VIRRLTFTELVFAVQCDGKAVGAISGDPAVVEEETPVEEAKKAETPPPPPPPKPAPVAPAPAPVGPIGGDLVPAKAAVVKTTPEKKKSPVKPKPSKGADRACSVRSIAARLRRMVARGKVQLVPPDQMDISAERRSGIPGLINQLTEPYYKLCMHKPLRAYKPWKKAA
jgi:hypothetical protein